MLGKSKTIQFAWLQVLHIVANPVPERFNILFFFGKILSNKKAISFDKEYFQLAGNAIISTGARKIKQLFGLIKNLPKAINDVVLLRYMD